MSTLQIGSTESLTDTHQHIRGFPLAGIATAPFLALLMAAPDGSIVDTATPRIIGDLRGFSLHSWVVTLSLLASTTTIPVGRDSSTVQGKEAKEEETVFFNHQLPKESCERQIKEKSDHGYDPC